MIPAASIVKIAPAAKAYAVELVKQAAEAGIMANPLRASSFLGQIHVESGGFERVVESLNYSTDALLKLFGRHRITRDEAEVFGRNANHPANQNALANVLYGGAWGAKALGNTEPGDGWRFRGRGLKQLTGRDNYARFSKFWLGDLSLLTNPERVAEPDGAVASAIWFWSANKLNETADTGDVTAVSIRVNGGTIGLPERKRWTQAYNAAWVDRPFANVVSRVTSTEEPQ